jgi:hypothetical protein
MNPPRRILIMLQNCRFSNITLSIRPRGRTSCYSEGEDRGSNPMHDAITVGVPVLAILLGILLNQRGLERLESRVDKLETRMDQRFDAVDRRFEGIDRRFDTIEARIDRIHADFGNFRQTLGQHDARLDAVEKRA